MLNNKNVKKHVLTVPGTDAILLEDIVSGCNIFTSEFYFPLIAHAIMEQLGYEL